MKDAEDDAEDLFGLMRVLEDAGILEDTGYGGYKVAVNLPELVTEVDLLRRKIKALEKKTEA